MTSQVNHAKIDEWFRKWRKPIRSWLRNRACVAPSEIDDLAQEVFIRVLRYSHDRMVDNPQGYLFRIASNVANEWRERSRVVKPHDDSWLEDLQINDDALPEEIFLREEMIAVVRQRLDKLKPRQRDFLMLHIEQNLTYKQIAQLRGTTYRTVLRDLTRSYAALRESLKEH